MTEALIIGGILILLLFPNTPRYSARYGNYEHFYPPPYPHFPMPPHYEAPQDDYHHYHDEKTRQSLIYTFVFLVLLVCALLYFGSNSTVNTASPQNTYNKPSTR